MHGKFSRENLPSNKNYSKILKQAYQAYDCVLLQLA